MTRRRAPKPWTPPTGVCQIDPDVPHPFDNGAWRAWVVGECPAPTAAQLASAEKRRVEARRWIDKREESFQRCDTDGFLSQWAWGLCSTEEREQARVESQGGHDLFPGLYRQDTGERVPAVLIDGKFGPCWALCDERGEFTGEFIGDARTRRAKLFREGYVVLGEWAPAEAKCVGEGTGLSGRAWIAVVRTDGGYAGRNRRAA